MGTLVFYLSISVFFSFLCSILEAVLLSVTPTFMNVQLKEGKRWAKTLQRLKADVDKPLIAILTLNTVAHTVGAIGVGAAAVKYFKEQSVVGISIADVIVPTLMTLVILIASEIIPKTIGATFWKQLAGFSTRVLDWMVKIMKYTGTLFLLQIFTKAFGKKDKESVLSRADYTTMTEMVSEQGVIEEGESRMITNLLSLDNELVEKHMTPRNVMEAASQDLTVAEYFKLNHADFPFSRIPIYGINVDDMTGFVLKDEMLTEMALGRGDKTLKDIKRDVLFVKRSMTLDQFLDKLMEKGPKGKNRHLAIVTNDFGGTEGIITMEDVMETILGLEIVDEMDTEEDMRVAAQKKWRKRSKDLGANK